jgi:hypothetical protein
MGALLKFQQYVAARRSASCSPEPPATPLAGPPFQIPPIADPLYLPPPSVNMSLHLKLDRLERKVDVLTQLLRGLM